MNIATSSTRIKSAHLFHYVAENRLANFTRAVEADLDSYLDDVFVIAAKEMKRKNLDPKEIRFGTNESKSKRF